MITVEIPFEVAEQKHVCEIQFEENYPLTLEFLFDLDGTEVIWTIGRDLVYSGLDSERWVGEDMVAVKWDTPNTICLRLISAETEAPAYLTFPRRPLLAFLMHTYALVSAGTEFDAFDWDAFEAEMADW